ncbi:hypothetical protein [Massilistercora timonensis]|uniref:M42 family metallopeptidase n=1 Tax=Massilistercora timonensis TaxID=2086584 RepID=UPI00320A3B8A
MDREQVKEMLCSLHEVAGISGRESNVGEKMRQLLEGCYDDFFVDTLGNYFFVKKGKGNKKIMLSAHMDEIGFLVSDIWDDGYVSFVPVGMHEPCLTLNQVLTIHTRNGKVEGVTGMPPVHQGKHDYGNISYKELKLDVGTHSKEETESLGIRPGDMITNERGYRILNKHIFSGKAVDNRAGCAAAIGVMRLLKDKETEYDVYCCGSVMEEMGVKGSGPAAELIKPDIAICFDVCFGASGKEMDANNRRNYLGDGPVIMLYDWNNTSCLGNIVPPDLADELTKTAENQRIPYQIGVTMNCGTDAALISLSGTGVKTAGIGIPNRYMHSAVGTVDLDDIYNASCLIAEWIQNKK